MRRRRFMKLGVGGAALLLPCPGPSRERAGKKLSFAILSDLHFAQTRTAYERYREQINELAPDFVVLNGDNVSDHPAFDRRTGKRDPERFGETYDEFTGYLDRIEPGIRVYPVIGNHDFCFPKHRNYHRMVQYLDEFAPFTRHHEALVQRLVPEARNPLYYSWDLRGWHFMALPCGNPEYLKRIGFDDWLEQDLAAHKDAPTIIFMHVPALSVGMCDNYFTEIEQKSKYLELFTRHGNVRYVLAGHIHNGTKVAIRSARKYRGTTFIICPTGVPQRQFGAYEYDPREDEFLFGFGFLVGEVAPDDQIQLFSLLRDDTRVPFPAEAPPFTYADNPVNFHPLTATAATVAAPGGSAFDGDFENGLNGWHESYEYIEEPEPSIIRQASTERVRAGKRSAMMLLRGRGCPKDFGRSPHYTSLYRLLPGQGRIGEQVFDIDYVVDRFVWAKELDKSEWASEVTPYRLREYPAKPSYSLGAIKIAFIRDDEAVLDTDVLFGRWGSMQPLPHGLLAAGSYVKPRDRETITRELDIGSWEHCRVTFVDRPAADQTFDKALIILTLGNDGLLGHEMKVFFDNVSLERA